MILETKEDSEMPEDVEEKDESKEDGMNEEDKPEEGDENKVSVSVDVYLLRGQFF